MVNFQPYVLFAICARVQHSSRRYSQIDVVNCNIDGRVYVRKSIEKRFALKTREVRSISFRYLRARYSQTTIL